MTAELARVSTVDALAGALRDRILDGDLAPGVRLPELELTAAYGVARHSARAALRTLAGEGLVTLEPNRGARVARLEAAQVLGLYELRTALELEAAHLALERHGGRLPAGVREAVKRLEALCGRKKPAWGAIVDSHNEVHSALVRAAGSERIERAYAALSGELRVFLMQLKPHWTLTRMASDHVRLIDDLERAGPPALREHLEASARAVAGSETS